MVQTYKLKNKIFNKISLSNNIRNIITSYISKNYKGEQMELKRNLHNDIIWKNYKWRFGLKDWLRWKRSNKGLSLWKSNPIYTTSKDDKYSSYKCEV
jgi:hypothetical protein